MDYVETAMGHGEIVNQAGIGGVTGAGIQANFGVNILFNTGGAFYSDVGKRVAGDVYRAQISGVNSNSDQARVMIMLHEWAHLLNSTTPTIRWAAPTRWPSRRRGGDYGATARYTDGDRSSGLKNM
jgi:hypothetical protein